MQTKYQNKMIEDSKNKAKDRDSKSGQFLPGNKAALTYGSHAFLKSGKVPSIRGKRKIRKHLGEIKADLEAITPGAEDNAKKKLLIEQIIRTEAALSLIEAWMKKASIVRPDKARRGILELQPVLANNYLAYLNSQRQAILALGLDEEKAEEVLTPYEIVEKEK